MLCGCLLRLQELPQLLLLLLLLLLPQAGAHTIQQGHLPL
jgi:hypothetical protein